MVGADTEVQDAVRYTPIMRATQAESWPTIEVLLAQRARSDHTGTMGGRCASCCPRRSRGTMANSATGRRALLQAIHKAHYAASIAHSICFTHEQTRAKWLKYNDSQYPDMRHGSVRPWGQRQVCIPSGINGWAASKGTPSGLLVALLAPERSWRTSNA